MGSLLAGVAHELNNPLAVLTGHAHLLREGAKDESLASRAEKIQAAADRCARIVKNFLALARPAATGARGGVGQHGDPGPGCLRCGRTPTSSIRSW